MASIENIRKIEALSEAYAKQDRATKLKSRRRCKECIYSMQIRCSSPNAVYGSYTTFFCNWAKLTNHNFRDCLPSECKYFEEGEKLTEPRKQIHIGGKNGR